MAAVGRRGRGAGGKQKTQSLDVLREMVAADPEARAAYEDAAVRDGLTAALVSARKTANRSQTDLADAMGTGQPFVSELENGRSADIYLGTAQRWARGNDHRLDVALVPKELPTYAEEGLPNVLWALVHRHSLSPILTTLVTARRNPGDRTLKALASSAGIPQPIVRAVLNSLHSLRWVTKEASANDETYSLDESAAYVIGISLHRQRVEGVLLDIYANVLDQATAFTDDSHHETIIDATVRLTKQLHATAPNGNVLGVGVSIAGVVVPRLTGRVEFAPEFESPEDPWHQVMLEAELQHRIQQELHDDTLLVTVENDANALALLQYWQTGDPTACVVLMSGTGIGSGYLANGEIVYGQHYAAGEIGHAAAVLDGPKCRAGLEHQGCLETIGSVEGIMRRLVPTAPPGEFDVESSLAIGDHLVQSGNPDAVSAFTEAGVAIGRFVTSLAAIVDPARIVIYGHPRIVDANSAAGGRFHAGFSEGWRHAESRRTRYAIPEICWEDLARSTNAVAAGAAAMSSFLANPMKWRPTVAPVAVSSSSATKQPDLAHAK